MNNINIKNINISNNNMNNLEQSLSRLYKSTLFIDNSQKHVDDILRTCNRGMTVIKVDETDKIQETSFKAPLMRKYIEKIGNNNSYMLAVNAAYNGNGRDRYDPISGIQVKHLPLIEKWINETREQTPRAILFDWDRTISVIEGMFITKDGMTGIKNMLRDMKRNVSNIPNVTIEDALLYLCGGQERLSMLRMIMTACVQLNIDIIFITNNTGCNSENMGAFDELVSGLLPNGNNTPHEIICSIQPPYYGDKGIAFQKSMPTKSSLICLSSQGGRRRNNTKKRSVSRKSYK